MMISHSAFVNIYNKDINLFSDLFSSKTLTELTKKIVQIFKRYSDLGYKDGDKLKGDLFEIFAECFFKILSADNRIGVYGYEPGPPTEDYGVDGVGLGMDEKPCTIQVKFRSNQTEELTIKDLKNFQGISYRKYGVPVDTNQNLILFTNAKGLHWITEANVLSGATRTIGGDQISKLVDGNTIFWKIVNDVVNNTIKIRFAFQ